MPLYSNAQGTYDSADQSLLVKAPTGTTFTLNSAATTNATLVKNSSTVITDAVLSNNGAAAAFVKLYNKASAPTVGTDIPLICLTVPALGHAPLDVNGLLFATGLSIAITNLAPDTDTTAVAAGQVKIFMQYR